MRTSAVPLWKRALTQPQNVKKVFEMVASQGIAKTRSVVEGKLTAGSPTGYSAAGTVLEVGEGRGATSRRRSRRVRGRAVRAPRRGHPRTAQPHGAGTRGSVARRGAARSRSARSRCRGSAARSRRWARRSSSSAWASWVRSPPSSSRRTDAASIGTDLDRRRIELALTARDGRRPAPADGDAEQQVARLTDGVGADGVIITAATSFGRDRVRGLPMCRRKKGASCSWATSDWTSSATTSTQKELDFLISSSYGPGRYDAALRGGGARLPDRLRALDREPQHGGVPPAGGRWAHRVSRR